MTTTTRIPQGDLKREYAELKNEINAAVATVLGRGEFILGREVEAFEREFASWLGVKHAVACASGTEAIALALMALGVGQGDEVVVPVNTCVPTASGILMTGAKPVGADVDSRTLMIDARSAKAACGPKTKAVMAVHLYGAPADLEALETLGVPIIEDCAQAHGTMYKGHKAGSIGRLSCFSFYPSKNLGAYGDGGLVATNEDALAERLRKQRNYGYSQRDKSELVGLNSRLDELQAAILRVKLTRLDDWNRARQAKSAQLEALLDGVHGIEIPKVVQGGRSVHHLFPVIAKDRDGLAAHLESKGVMTRVHYPIPLHLQPSHANWGKGVGSFPIAEEAAKRVLSLPMFPQLTNEELAIVAGHVREFYA